jgi:hypothetical protein
MPDKQTVQTTHEGLNVTWQRDAGTQSSKQAGDFIVDVASAVERFKQRDPRRWPLTRAILGGLGLLAAGFVLGSFFTSAPPIPPTPIWQVEAGAIPQPRAAERSTTPATPPQPQPQASAAALPSQIEPTDPPELARAKRHLSTRVFDYLVQQTRVSLGRAEFRDNPDGTHDVLVPVSWHVDPTPVMLALNEYFWDVDHGPLETSVDFSSDFNPAVPGTSINRHFNQRHNRKSPYAEQLLDWLSSWQLQIVVTLGARSGVVTLASGREYFLIKCKGVGRDQYQFQFNHDAGDKILLFSNTGAEQDPVRIANVSGTARDALGDIASHIQWTKLH